VILLEERNEEIKSNTKRKRKKKRTKTQEAHRQKILSLILDKWVCVKTYGHYEDSYIFMKHRIPEGGTHSKIEQMVLSNDELQDGVYIINDYDIDLVFDRKTGKEVVELKPKKFDLKIGLYSEEEMIESFSALKERLLRDNYVTNEELSIYCQSDYKQNHVEEIRLAYDIFQDEKEA
jgi:hypothetical protein